ncbi:MAG: hypothetical protein RR327_08940 [Clostridia bacterium]
MNKEKLIANWDNLTAETKAQILQLAEKEIEKGWFLPKRGEVYYFWDMNFVANEFVANEITTHSETYGNTVFDNINLAVDNCFRTREEAIFYGDCYYYTKRFETYVNRYTEKIDWTDYDQSKYYVFYNLDDMDIEYDYIYSYKQQGTTYASSEQILRDAIADIGEENFLKYVMKVEV